MTRGQWVMGRGDWEYLYKFFMDGADEIFKMGVADAPLESGPPRPAPP